ncbi:tetratricopeptide repeat protein [Nocardiopsis sp. HNM0947]|uniref:Tetratricopeptide repeat protein n=1 Tax=Nocardiopsis coralli TaxID=2772213 RepID=A0ABR9PDY5_9ACTN|nr:LuxR C-terminal-related transcriptional regulator [Nocardiopsis coralli]MBE3002066.1 tetratricopeptide repeat protein [Nocardiopsis coralli]
MAPLTAPARHNLPRPNTGFVGRERDLSDLLRLLDSSRSVTLCGPDGMGKTRLALRVAEQSTVSFPDGVWFADLGDTRTALDVFARVAAAVGVVEEPGQALAATVAEAMGHRRLLLVLDGCGHIEEAVDEVGRALLASCPQVSLLLTSEAPVRLPGGTVWRVPPMALPVAARKAPPPDPARAEAVRLFLDRARTRDPRFSASPEELEEIAMLCDMAGGVPLGVEVLGASAPETGPARLVEDLRAHLSSPSARPGPGQAVSRSQVLPLVLEHAYLGLSEPERVLLRRLSVFRGWDLELAERVCADDLLPEGAVLDLLTSLLNRALITVTGEYEGRVRYRLPDAVRAFASGRLAEAGESDLLQRRLMDRMLDLTEHLARQLESSRPMPWAERDEGRQRVLTEYDTVRALVSRALDTGAAEDGLRLCVNLVAHWVSHNSYAEGAHWMDGLLALDEAAKAPSLARALVARAQLARVQRDHEQAVALGEEGLRLSRESGDDVFVRTALNLLALVEVREHLPERASVHVEEALRLCRETGDQWGEAISLGTRAALVAQQGDFPTAEQHYNAALTLLRGMDHRWGVGVTLIGQAGAAEAAADLMTADRCYREALDTQRMIGATGEEARCLAGIGRVAQAQGHTGQAYDYLSEGLVLGLDTGQRWAALRSLTSIARVAFGQGLREPACRLAGAAVAVRERLGMPARPLLWPFGDVEPEGAERERLLQWWREGADLCLAQAAREAERLIDEARNPAPRRRRRAPEPEQEPSAAEPEVSHGAPAPEACLTRRELEVAQLVSRGRTNPQIAEELFISPSTAARHVANINRKTGFRSRAQIAEWVRGHSAGG